ncbi:Extracellular exo-alpha-like protein [Ilyonectria robusta]
MALVRILEAGLVLGSLFGSTSAFTNPIRSPGGSDPQVTYSGGWYYLISTEWDNLQLARAETIEGLKIAESKIIYSDTNASRCCNVWAPELHFFDGNWYLYYTAGNSGATNLDNQRSHVIKGRITHPITD